MQVWIYVGFQTGISNILSPPSGMPLTREPGISGLWHFVFLHVSLFSLHPLHTYIRSSNIHNGTVGLTHFPMHALCDFNWAGYGFTTVSLPQNVHNDLWYWKKRSFPLMEGYSAYTYVRILYDVTLCTDPCETPSIDGNGAIEGSFVKARL